ncbi:hypothetical protein CB1_000125005 [Camelus ferus]|nr:hypothetical protein CB1_000125005 [Camelus ferus]
MMRGDVTRVTRESIPGVGVVRSSGHGLPFGDKDTQAVMKPSQHAGARATPPRPPSGRSRAWAALSGAGSRCCPTAHESPLPRTAERSAHLHTESRTVVSPAACWSQIYLRYFPAGLGFWVSDGTVYLEQFLQKSENLRFVLDLISFVDWRLVRRSYVECGTLGFRTIRMTSDNFKGFPTWLHGFLPLRLSRRAKPPQNVVCVLLDCVSHTDGTSNRRSDLAQRHPHTSEHPPATHLLSGNTYRARNSEKPSPLQMALTRRASEGGRGRGEARLPEFCRVSRGLGSPAPEPTDQEEMDGFVSTESCSVRRKGLRPGLLAPPQPDEASLQ